MKIHWFKFFGTAIACGFALGGVLVYLVFNTLSSTIVGFGLAIIILSILLQFTVVVKDKDQSSS